ncbi:hypothetical protein HYALB_00007939 [Hymenoscyphus albidus]|uniref:Uncharacterized protein n=1 Tax=Hymenoscyphus albidus TaxID=595503 RepID=A0A9N9LN07_9HELO|nr:hypothetical protein HYALB_00007939 [Hymenoscyphus albidus]
MCQNLVPFTLNDDCKRVDRVRPYTIASAFKRSGRAIVSKRKDESSSAAQGQSRHPEGTLLQPQLKQFTNRRRQQVLPHILPHHPPNPPTQAPPQKTFLLHTPPAGRKCNEKKKIRQPVRRPSTPTPIPRPKNTRKRAKIIATPYTASHHVLRQSQHRHPHGQCGSKKASLLGIEDRLIVRVGV